MTWRLCVVVLLAFFGFCWSGLALRDHSRPEQAVEVLRVRLPLLVQLAYAAGDPYLAANINVFRSLMVDPRITEGETYRIQARLQVDASVFNPRHEDNYYVGAAILPWNGQIAAVQQILLRAADSRPWDMWPAFFYAFNAMYFEHDMAKAGHWAEVAAQRHPRNAAALREMAAKWYERGDDPAVALGILNAMREQSRDDNFRRLLAVRLQRLEGLQALRRAARAYQAEHAAAPSSLAGLLGYAGLTQLPRDPLELGYVLDATGQPQLADHVSDRKTNEGN